jgi:quercetin dioxygenase-like cupin family protein
MSSTFPKPIQNLPEANIPLDGVKAYLAQGEHHQVVFMEFMTDVTLPEHSHEDQWELVLEGTVDLWMSEKKHSFKRGDRFFIPKGVIHSAKVYAGYASIVFFNQKDRYGIR